MATPQSHYSCRLEKVQIPTPDTPNYIVAVIRGNFKKKKTGYFLKRFPSDTA